MIAPKIRRFPMVLLSAFMLAVVACPLWFVALGALGQYSPLFSVVMVPPFVGGAAYLLTQYLTVAGKGKRRLMRWLEVPSWVAVAAFAFLVSGIGLVTPFEHAGSLAVSLLVTAVLWMPLLLWRHTELEQRVSSLSPASATVAAGMLILAIGLVAVAYLRAPAHFIGGPRGAPPPLG